MPKPHIEAWKDRRFGMFMHWGLYSILGEGEWAMFNKPIDKDEYRTLLDRFTAERFDPRVWVEAAKSAGMKYMVLTARHHDGFSLFDSKHSVDDFTSMRAAVKRDIVAEYTRACREAGLGVGLYYSPMDWRLPGYFLPRLYKRSADQMREQCHQQVRELLSNYGKIDVLWYDGGEDFWLSHGMNVHKLGSPKPPDFEQNPQVPDFWRAAELDAMARKLQPEIVISNRSGMRQFGDFLTPECRVGEFNTAEPWETCHCLSHSGWGWQPNSRFRSLRECIQMLVRVVTGDGNLLLNVGPKPDGSIEVEEVARLKEIGVWLSANGESIYGTRGGPLANGAWGGTTWKESRLYVHVIEWRRNFVSLPKTAARRLQVRSLTAGSVECVETDDAVRLSVPEENRQDIDTVMVVEYDRPVDQVFTGIAPDFMAKNN